MLISLNYNNKFVITGGPGFGKTTLIKKLEELGHHVFHEAARAIIEEQKKYDDPIFPWKDRIRFDRELINKLIFDYKAHTSNMLCFYDRGIPDLIGWRKYAGLDSNDIKKLVYIYPYEKLVFLTQPWREIYQSNEDRPYSFKEASTINQILKECYSNLGYDIQDIPNQDIITRVEFVLERISSFK
jgi:predicted ATPase